MWWQFMWPFQPHSKINTLIYVFFLKMKASKLCFILMVLSYIYKSLYRYSCRDKYIIKMWTILKTFPWNCFLLEGNSILIAKEYFSPFTSISLSVNTAFLAPHSQTTHITLARPNFVSSSIWFKPRRRLHRLQFICLASSFKSTIRLPSNHGLLLASAVVWFCLAFILYEWFLDHQIWCSLSSVSRASFIMVLSCSSDME